MAVAYSLNEEVWRARWTHGPAVRDAFVRALGAIDPAPVSQWADPLAFLEPMALLRYNQPEHLTTSADLLATWLTIPRGPERDLMWASRTVCTHPGSPTSHGGLTAPHGRGWG